jgi:hypothetical protein
VKGLPERRAQAWPSRIRALFLATVFSSPKKSGAGAGSQSSHGAAMVRAGASSARTQGVRIAALFAQPRTKRCAVSAAAIAVACAVWFPAPARAEFGFLSGAEGFSALATAEGGVEADEQAGSHPYSLLVEANLRLAGDLPGRPGTPASEGDLRDLHLELPPGLIEDPLAVPQCTVAEFHTPRSSPFEASRSGESCPDETQVGYVTVRSSVGGGQTRSFGLFNLVPPPGKLSELGFSPFGEPVTIAPHIRQAEGGYGVTLDLQSFPQSFDLYGLRIVIWGKPWGISHDGLRGNCLDEAEASFPWAKCQVSSESGPLAYLTMPTGCEGPLSILATADSWQEPGAYLPDGEPDLGDPAWKTGVSQQPALSGCWRVPFAPRARTAPGSDRAASPIGFDFALEQEEAGLLSPDGIAPSPLRRSVVSLPEGLTLNPSLAAGLGSCAPGQYAAEALASAEREGCPNDSKIGEVSVQSPFLSEPLTGSVYLADPRDNPSGSLLGLYLIARSSARGVLVKLAGQLTADPGSGRLTAVFEGLPQLPYSRLEVDFREGQRAPLVSPPFCASYASGISLTPWSTKATPVEQTSTFAIAQGIGGSACPSGPAPFAPGATAGALNSAGGADTSFYLHLTRSDADQEITSYSATLPPGLLGDIAGVPFCPDADIAAATTSSGAAEESSPSCPSASQIGRTYTGYGVGSVLAYAPGALYLSGPYHGSPLSVVAIDSAHVGPFDLGVVVIRSAIDVDPHDARVTIDSSGSDPIPHILDGIPLHLRDIRVYLDRPGFAVNPTDCAASSVSSTLTGSAVPFTNPRQSSATVTVPFQVSDCSALGFRPRFELKLRGGVRRGRFPSLRAILAPRAGDANLAGATVTLPGFEFLEQAHIKTVCTRPHLESETCPTGSIYGHAEATTPLLEAPMSGPVYLATGFGHALPDLVTVLHGRGVKIVLDGQIDTHKGGIRATFSGLPDAPVSRFVMTLDGGRRGILANERNVCTAPESATALFTAQDGAGVRLHPKLTDPLCKRHGRHKRARHDGSRK